MLRAGSPDYPWVFCERIRQSGTVSTAYPCQALKGLPPYLRSAKKFCIKYLSLWQQHSLGPAGKSTNLHSSNKYGGQYD
jgi:hypothetical protein